LDERGLSAPADARHAGEKPPWDGDVDGLEVVAPAAAEDDPAIAIRGRHVDRSIADP
jgi:hypothetical protein